MKEDFQLLQNTKKDIAEIYEQELDYEHSMQAYQQSADLYEGEGSQSSANSCLQKVAQFSAHLQNYDKAIEIYEKIATTSLDNSLLKFTVKELFLKAGLCHLCTGDLVSAKKALEKYEEMDPGFSNQRECKFLHDIIEAYENCDVSTFTNVVIEYDTITKLDQWKTSLLLKVKGFINSEEGGLV